MNSGEELVNGYEEQKNTICDNDTDSGSRMGIDRGF